MDFFFTWGGCVMFTWLWVFVRQVASTVILVPKPFRGCWRIGGQLRRSKECPFSGITKSGSVWRKIPESKAQCPPPWCLVFVACYLLFLCPSFHVSESHSKKKKKPLPALLKTSLDDVLVFSSHVCVLCFVVYGACCVCFVLYLLLCECVHVCVCVCVHS